MYNSKIMIKFNRKNTYKTIIRILANFNEKAKAKFAAITLFIFIHHIHYMYVYRVPTLKIFRLIFNAKLD